MTELRIRAARADDQVAIREVTLSAYQEYAAVMDAHRDGSWDGYRRSILATLATVQPAEQIVAEHDEMIVGTVLLLPAGTVLTPPNGVSVTLTYPEIRLLAVSPARRGRGIGAALVHECLRRARESGAAALTLHTTDMMRVAMGMYERMGFARASELDFHPSPEITIKGYRYRFDPGASSPS
jgi:ribosomal protein S18 acetylase RimI-like enzyme